MSRKEEKTLSSRLRVSCPLAPRTESYDTRMAETRACPRPIRAVLSVPVISVAPSV